MNVEEYARTLGLPGLVVLVWYLLEVRRSKVEEAKVAAMGEGFKALSAQIVAHQRADLESHAEMSTALARIEKGLDVAQARADRNDPPAHGERIARNHQNGDR